jgi:hypothetical protein
MIYKIKLAYFDMIQNYDNFKRWNAKFDKIYIFKILLKKKKKKKKK